MGWRTTGVLFEVKQSVAKRAALHGALSWWSIHMSAFVAHEWHFFWTFQGRFYKKLSWQFLLHEQNLFWLIPFRVKKKSHLFNLQFFKSSMCHSLLCLLVSGSHSKIHDSSPLITWLKKFSPLTILSITSKQVFFRLSFCAIGSFLTSFWHRPFACANVAKFDKL